MKYEWAGSLDQAEAISTRPRLWTVFGVITQMRQLLKHLVVSNQQPTASVASVAAAPTQLRTLRPLV